MVNVKSEIKSKGVVQQFQHVQNTLRRQTECNLSNYSNHSNHFTLSKYSNHFNHFSHSNHFIKHFHIMQTTPTIPTNEIFYRYQFCRILCDLCKGWLGGVYFRFFSVPHCLDSTPPHPTPPHPTPPHLCSYEETPHLTLLLGTPPFPFGSVENHRSRRVSFQHTFLATTIVFASNKKLIMTHQCHKSCL